MLPLAVSPRVSPPPTKPPTRKADRATTTMDFFIATQLCADQTPPCRCAKSGGPDSGLTCLGLDELVQSVGGLIADGALHRWRPAEQLAPRTQCHPRPAPEVEGVLLPGDQPILEPELGADVVVDVAAGLGEDVLRLPRGGAGGVVDRADLVGQLQALAAPRQHLPHRPRAVALEGPEDRVAEPDAGRVARIHPGGVPLLEGLVEAVDELLVLFIH